MFHMKHSWFVIGLFSGGTYQEQNANARSTQAWPMFHMKHRANISFALYWIGGVVSLCHVSHETLGVMLCR